MNKSILIIDNDVVNRESIRDWLIYSGFEVTTAETAGEARDILNAQEFAAILTNIRLDDDNGFNILREAKIKYKNIKSFTMTAYPSSETAAIARQIGVIAYFVKPFSPADVGKLIKATVEGTNSDTILSSVSARRLAAIETVRLKQSYSLDKSELRSVIDALLKEMEVVGVKSRQGKFVYDRIHRFEELVFDYDVTVMPPTRYLFPEREALLKYNIGEKTSTKAVYEETPRAIIGVHPYDLHAIELLDQVFIATNPDPNYIARRNNTIIIGFDCLHPSQHCFSPSMGTNIADGGFDLFITDIGKSFIAVPGTERGIGLLEKYTRAAGAKDTEIILQQQLREKAWAEPSLINGHFLNLPREKLPKLLEDSYDDPFWETRSETCLSCGSCVMVCPTCFCFDVQDEVDLSLKSGQRVRSWDGCMLVDFAKIASGENFRHDKASRLRHRIFRKGKYVIERYGRMGCVGCGRCSSACLAEIASPLEAFNILAESAVARKQAIPEVKAIAELYQPQFAEIVKVTTLTPREKVFDIRLPEGKKLGHRPGQFVEVMIPAIGEAPLSISSSPTRGNTFQLAVRDTGNLTHALHELSPGAKIGIRGPFGNGFPLEKLRGNDIILIAGGIGLFPLRSLIEYVIDERKLFGKVTILFGARSPAERIFTDELASWSNIKDIEFMESVDRGDENWKGNVGVITTLIPRLQIDLKKTMAVIVGPPVMYRFVLIELKRKNLPDDNVIMSLERRMKCGVGKCGHCQINNLYVCQEGPVFSYAQLRNLREAI